MKGFKEEEHCVESDAADKSNKMRTETDHSILAIKECYGDLDKNSGQDFLRNENICEEFGSLEINCSLIFLNLDCWRTCY